MRAKGINYDTGFINKGTSSRELGFDIATIAREIQIIRDDLHCNALRITGGDPQRLELVARIAAEAGLEIWFSPFTCDLSEAAMHDLLADCAERAERIRQSGAEVVLVLGAEISLLNTGFLPGETIAERLALLSHPDQLRAMIPELRQRVHAFFLEAVADVRSRFGGRITYAAIPFEGIDWALFDIVSLDSYRSAAVADFYAASVRSLVAQGKPVAITEFGMTPYTGAGAIGARAGEIIVWDENTARPLGLNGVYERNEAEQATYVRELLEIFDQAGVDSTFVFTFVQYALPHRPEAQHDLDIASYGVVKVYEDRFGETYPDMRWEPKQAFAAVAACYAAPQNDTLAHSNAP